MTLINIRNLHLAFGGAAILDGVDFTLSRGERVCLIGRNGEGKSTLLKLINGNIVPDDGELVINNDVRITMLEQDVPVNSGTVAEIVLQGAGELADTLLAYEKLSHACASGDMAACEKMTELQVVLDNQHGWDLKRQVESLIQNMQLDPEADISSLSGGRKRRVLLARALLAKPDILLLDEPTNHLDIDSITWLENMLLGWQNLTLLFITHDRAFVDVLATRIVELDRGVLRSYDVRSPDIKSDDVKARQHANGENEQEKAYSRYLTLKQQQLEAEEKANAQFDKKLAEEEAWIRQGIKARRTRNEGRVRALKSLREERKARREKVGDVNIAMSDGEKSGKLVCKLKNLKLSYEQQGQAHMLVDGFSASIVRGDKIGIIGANGVGKSTLIHSIFSGITGNDMSDITRTGSVKLGTNLEVAFFDQLRDQLDLEQSVAFNVSEGSDYVEVAGRKKHILGYLQDFLFAPERARTPVKALSGGERNRVLLAKQLLKPANVLVLDEPTNDLDMATLELLEEAVTNFNGTVLLISHDRAFMDNVVTSTWVFEGEGKVTEYVGGYQDYLRQAERIQEMQAQAKKNVKQNLKQNLKQNDGSTKADTKRKITANDDNAASNQLAEKTSGSKAGGKNLSSSKKLSYKEQRELAALPDEIAALETEQTQLEEKLADGTWFASDAKAATEATHRLAEIEMLLMEKLERWTALDG